MRHHIFIKILISIGALGLVSIASPAYHAHQPVVQASQRSQSIYFKNRINRFARQRQPYYHPQITYNTRDLGGIRTADGHYMIRPHLLYRSANLHYLTRYGANQLRHLHIHKDIDLRQMRGPNVSITKRPQPGEIKQYPDRYHIRMRYYHYPVETSKQEAYTWPIRKRLGETYRFGYWYTTSPTARRAYHNSIMLMIHSRGPIIFNCTQGRDRTGVLSAITEYLLGVSKYNIYNDFLLTNHYKYQSPYTDQITRLNRFYTTMHRAYGPTWRYCRYGLGITNHDIRKLQRKYLIRI